MIVLGSIARFCNLRFFGANAELIPLSQLGHKRLFDTASPGPRTDPHPFWRHVPFMSCDQLARRIVKQRPDLPSVEVARLCVLILNQYPDPCDWDSDEKLQKVWQNVSFRLEAVTDQHAAVAAELEMLAGDQPTAFDPEQLWTLLRAVKVQSQILELYTDTEAFA